MAKKKTPSKSVIPAERIETAIYLIRGQKVMLDTDLAELYGVETFNLNKAVKRNPERFPEDFMFQLTEDEWKRLKFQTGMSKRQGSCVQLFVCGKCWRCTRNWPGNSNPWRRNTTGSSK